MLYFSKEELRNKRLVDLIHHEDVKSIEALFRQLIKGSLDLNREETRYFRKNGQIAWGRLSISLIRDAEGKPFLVIAMIEDVTERKQTDIELSLLATAIKQATESILITDSEGTIEYANPAFERVSGIQIENAIDQKLNSVQGHLQDEEFHQAMWETLKQGRIWKGQIISKRPDGRQYIEEASISPVRDANGNIIHYVVVKCDATNERQLEARFRHAQKMEAVGQLAGGIAHDFNNIIGVVLGYSDLILRKLSETDPLRTKVEMIRNVAQKAAQITRQLLAFSRRQLLQPRVLDLNARLREILEMVQQIIGENIQPSLQLAEEEMSIKVDPNYLDQVIMNMVVNARDAMPQGGKLVFETSRVDIDAMFAANHADATPGKYVLLKITDTGIGMSPEIRSRVFEPFFTTKGTGKGTGLGLSTAYGIVKQSGGFIDLESEVNKGTTFKIYFPAVFESSPKKTVPKELKDLPRGTETILLVEDEEPVRKMVHEILMEQGYTILCANNGEEALHVFDNYQKKIDLLFTDVVMPKMGGVELSERLRQRAPNIKVLFTSGYAQGAFFQTPKSSRSVSFLPKPFEPSSLLKRVHDVLREN